MLIDPHIRRSPTLRRLAALASVIALSLGTLSLAGCGNDDELPPMEEPAEDPGMEQSNPMESDSQQEGSMGEQDPMSEESTMGSPENQEDQNGF